MTTEPPDDTSPESGNKAPLQILGGVVVGILAGAALVVVIGITAFTNAIVAIGFLVAIVVAIVFALRRGAHRESSFRVGFFVGLSAMVVLGGGACISLVSGS